jgi:hypothetical protein
MQPVTENTTEDLVERLPWHQPSVEKLEVHLDTRYQSGSNTDGYDGSGPG